MLAVVAYVSSNPGCAILPVASALHIGARTGRNNAHGYNPVHRAIRAGLIKADRSRGVYSLTVTSAGLQVLP